MKHRKEAEICESIVLNNVTKFIEGMREYFSVGNGEFPNNLEDLESETSIATFAGLPPGLIAAANAYFLHPRGMCLVVSEISASEGSPGVAVPMLIALKDTDKVFSYRKETLKEIKGKLKQFDKWSRDTLRPKAQGINRIIELQQLHLFPTEE